MLEQAHEGVCVHCTYMCTCLPPQLLHDQLGVVTFEPYKPFFMLLFSQSRTAFSGIPLLPSLAAYPQRNWCATPPPTFHALSHVPRPLPRAMPPPTCHAPSHVPTVGIILPPPPSIPSSRQDAGAKGGLPATAVKLSTLVQRLQVSYMYMYNA